MCNVSFLGMKNGISATVLYSSDDGDGCYIQVSKRPSSMEMSVLTPTGSAKVDRPRSNTSEAKLMAKKRVIRMLIVIVAMFFICWMPLYSVNTWKAFDLPSAHSALSGAPISFIHLLSYTSACVNPIIYCFMNKRFRKALFTTFSCCCWPCRRRGFREGDDEVTATGASMSKFNYTTVSTMGPCWFSEDPGWARRRWIGVDVDILRGFTLVEDFECLSPTCSKANHMLHQHRSLFFDPWLFMLLHIH